MAIISDQADLMVRNLGSYRPGGADETNLLNAMKSWLDSNRAQFKDNNGNYPIPQVLTALTQIRKV